MSDTYLAVAGSNGRLKIYKVTLNEHEKSVAAELIAQLFEGNRAMISSLKFYDLKVNTLL